MPPALPLRFVTRNEAERFTNSVGFHEWLCKPGLTECDLLKLIRVEMQPGHYHAFHRHPHMEEIIYVISGRGEQWVEQECRILGPGDSAHIPMNAVHGLYNVGGDCLIFLAILSPANSAPPDTIELGDQEPWKSLRPVPG
jgi:quercetin dioxygenase-like cupin family protein